MDNVTIPANSLAAPQIEPPPIAIVLAAGKGTRMKSELPKVLCPANGRPLVEYVLDALRDAGIGRIIVVVGYRAGDVQRALASWSDLDFALQSQQLGTGHAVMVCRDRIAKHDGPVVIVAGDSPMLQASSLSRLLDEYRDGRPACVLGTLIHDDPRGLGRIVRDAAGKFVAIVEEKDANDIQREICEVNMSTYVFDCQKMLAVLDSLKADNRQQEYYLTDLPGLLLKQSEDIRALPVLKPIEALSVNTTEHLKLVEAQLQRSTSE
jgi:bifunctional UDP-N-acetylglucosamine pyrophosphorylase/glucosamine-1-phosphate N-acetyltransferase/UDP-N-acetylglucosamine pyrophosphorylase